MSDDPLKIDHVSGYWHHTARTIKVFGINAYVVAPFLVLLFWPRLWVLLTLIISIVVAWGLEKFGYTPYVMFLTIRSIIAGSFVSRCRKAARRRIWMK